MFCIDLNQKKLKVILNFDLIVADNCCACVRVEKELRKYSEEVSFIYLKISSQEFTPYKTTIVPALFINGKLFSYGDIDLNKLNKKVKNLYAKELTFII